MMAGRRRTTAAGMAPMVAMGALMVLPLALGLRNMRAGLGSAAEANRALLAPLGRPVAEAIEHLADRVAVIRAEILDAAGAPVPDADLEIDIVTGRLAEETGAGPAPPRLAIAHAAGGRLRLVARGGLGEADGAALAAAVAGFPGVRRADWRRASASLVVESVLAPERLAAALERAGLLRITGRAARPPAAQGAALLLGWLDGLIRLRSRGAGDLDQVIAMGVLAAALAGRDPALSGIPPETLVARVMARRRVARG